MSRVLDVCSITMSYILLRMRTSKLI